MIIPLNFNLLFYTGSQLMLDITKYSVPIYIKCVAQTHRREHYITTPNINPYTS